MRTIRRTSQFKKDIKHIKKWGKDLSKLKEVLEKITRGQELEARYRDHVLVGQYRGSLHWDLAQRGQCIGGRPVARKACPEPFDEAQDKRSRRNTRW